MFLQNISKIEFYISKKEFGFVERVEEDNYYVTIRRKTIDCKNIEISNWLRFTALKSITDEQGNSKSLPISIAYKLNRNKKDEKFSIVPIKGGGKTFIYFPAEKEHSGLRFHINAPFASTVARDSVRDCTENLKLIEEVAVLVAKSMAIIKKLGLINNSMFETLPNNKDNLSNFYSVILNYVCNAFKYHEYIPTKNGEFVNSDNALSGPAALSNLFDEENLIVLFNITKKWIINPLKNTHADYFIQSLNVQLFTYLDFVSAFSSTKRYKLEEVILDKKIDWLRNFYLVCCEAYDYIDYSSKNYFLMNAKSTLFIQSAKKQFYKPNEIYILPEDIQLISKSTNIVNPRIYDIPKNNKNGDRIQKFFLSMLGIQKYGPRIEVLRLLERYNEKIIVNEEYFETVLVFAKYNEKNHDIQFENYNFFLFCDENGEYHQEYAENLYLGSKYGNFAGTHLAKAYKKNCLSDEYLNYYNNDEITVFVDFAKKCGIKTDIYIVQCSASNHPQFHYKLYSPGKITNQSTNSDYTIESIQGLLNSRSIPISKIIWNTLSKNGSTSKYAIARYSPNGQNVPRKCESTLIYYLKKIEWIPNKHNDYCRPQDMQISDLRQDFIYDPDNKLFCALEFGKTKNDADKQNEQIIQQLKKSGLHVISDDEYRKFEEWKKLEKSEKQVSNKRADELLKKEIKRKKAEDDNEFDNLASINIESAFKNAKKMRPSIKKLFSKVNNSSKKEKAFLMKWYNGICQMCHSSIIGYNSKPHFVARNVINTQHLPVEARNTTELAWNSLCLCPNCAAKYIVCSKDISDLYEQILNIEIDENDTKQIVLTIELDGKEQPIIYVYEHFKALKEAIKIIDDCALE